MGASLLANFVIEASGVGPTLVCTHACGWWTKIEGQKLDAINRAARTHATTHCGDQPR